ncbi:MAG: hypothetical protein KAV87_49905 [Desulfobacteraceae bacterium]|nr:hypothetical protein [Desulfobacteraceae bacterium]
MPAGQPTKYNAKVKKQILAMALKSFTDAEMCDILNIDEQTINNWKKAHPKFFESLKNAKKKADQSVVKSLLERATGYEHKEDKIFCNAEGIVTTVKTIKRYPPDPTSMIFWLKNRDKENWRDKQDYELYGKDGKDLVPTIINVKLVPTNDQKE